jgi:hypothetical protein
MHVGYLLNESGVKAANCLGQSALTSSGVTEVLAATAMAARATTRAPGQPWRLLQAAHRGQPRKQAGSRRAGSTHAHTCMQQHPPQLRQFIDRSKDSPPPPHCGVGIRGQAEVLVRACVGGAVARVQRDFDGRTERRALQDGPLLQAARPPTGQPRKHAGAGGVPTVKSQCGLV